MNQESLKQSSSPIKKLTFNSKNCVSTLDKRIDSDYIKIDDSPSLENKSKIVDLLTRK